jgi:hypothetical protein
MLNEVQQHGTSNIKIGVGEASASLSNANGKKGLVITAPFFMASVI